MKCFKRRKFPYLFNFVLLSAIAVAIAGCEDDDGTVVEPVSVAYVSLYHASPDAPPLDIVMENRQINFYPLQYRGYTGYLNFFSGERDMRVRPNGDDNVIIDTTFTFEEGEAYSVFYVNQLSNIQALLIEDELAAPTAGNAAVRFIHLSPDASVVDLVRTADDEEDIVVENHDYLDATEFLTVESGLQSFEVKGAGSEEVLLNIPDVVLLSGGVYTIVMRGFATPPSGNTNNLGAQILTNN